MEGAAAEVGIEKVEVNAVVNGAEVVEATGIVDALLTRRAARHAEHVLEEPAFDFK